MAFGRRVSFATDYGAGNRLKLPEGRRLNGTLSHFSLNNFIPGSRAKSAWGACSVQRLSFGWCHKFLFLEILIHVWGVPATSLSNSNTSLMYPGGISEHG